jgi:hypothetical protein
MMLGMVRTSRLAAALGLVVWLAGPLGCGRTTEAAQPTQGGMPVLVPAPADEVAVDLAVARKAWDPSKGELLVFPQSSRFPAEPKLPSPYRELWPAFQDLNSQPSALPDLRGRIDGLTLLTPEDAARVGGRMVGSEAFRAAFPKAGAVLSLSRAAFSPDGTLALVYGGYSCGGLCGNGSYYELAHTAEGWIVVSTVTVWVS